MATSKPGLPGKNNFRTHWLARYGFALLAVIVAFLIREGLTRLAGGSLPAYITLYPAVMLSALFGGFGPGLLATVGAAMGVDYFILSPQGSLAIASLSDAVGLAIFSGMGVFMSEVAELYHRARQMAAAQESGLDLHEGDGALSRRSGQGLLLNAGLVLSLAVLTLAVGLAVWNLRALAAADQREAHTRVVIQEFDRLLSALKDAETGQRGYLLTGNEKYLEPYRVAPGLIQTNLMQLKQLTLDNASQQQRLTSLQNLSRQKMAELQQTIELRRTQGWSAALAIVQTGTGKNLMDQIRQQVAQAQNEEERLLQQRAATKTATVGKTLRALLAGGVLSFLVLATVFFFLKQENLRRAKAEAELRQHRDHLQELVAARTGELRRTNEQLTEEIAGHKQASEALRQLNRTLKALSDSNQAMMRVQDENQYLQEVCRVIMEDCGHPLVWIGFAENDEAQSIRPAAWAGIETGYLESLRLTWADTERGRGPTGTAIRTGKPCACTNMQTDPAFAPWRQEAVKRGYVSSVALPLFSAGKAFGALTIYSRQPDPFAKEELKLLSDLANDLAQGVATLRLRAERAQKEEQLRLQLAALQSAANGLVITGRDGTIQWVNDAFTRLTGYRAAEAIGQNPRVLKSGRHKTAFYKEMWAAILAGRDWHGEVINRRKDGSLYPEEMTITPVSNAGGEITHFVAVKQDISARKNAEAALQRSARELARSNEELQQFAYVASHDLQEPLRAVSGYLTLIEEGLGDQLDDKGRHQIAGAIQGAQRMSALINDLLELSRVGTRAKALEPADLNAVLAAALDNLSVRFKETGARIVAEPLPTLKLDANQITMLLQNLIANALKFHGPEPPEIHVSARLRDGQWAFAVRDNGIGIHPQYFERIFRIFQRLHTRGEYPGTGIGLAICKKIVERHGGRIWVESQPGQGSTFYFTIPA